MTWLFITEIGAVGLILFVAFIASRLLRSRKMGVSLRMQIFLALAGIVFAFALGLGLLVLDRVQARATRIAEDSARAEATAIAAIVATEIAARESSLQEIGARFDAAAGREALILELTDVEGRSLFKSEGSDAPNIVWVGVPLRVDGRLAGSVRVGKPTIVIERTLAELAPTVLVLSLVLGAAAAASAALIGRAIGAPIEGLTEFAVQVSEGRRASPPRAYGREVQRLTKAIETMHRELEGRPFVETFAADLSHELKNPVAAIRASAEVLLDSALEEPQQAKRFVLRIREATTRIEALLGDLLSLARLEARGVDDADRVDLLVVAERAKQSAHERGRRLTLSGTKVLVRGDLGWLTRAIDNLVDNAFVHGKGDGPVELVVSQTKEMAHVDVLNEGAIGRHVAKNLFRRFVTTRPDRGGTGLGLAIVQAVAEAHGGVAECVEPGPPRVVFRFSVPRD